MRAQLLKVYPYTVTVNTLYEYEDLGKLIHAFGDLDADVMYFRRSETWTFTYNHEQAITIFFFKDEKNAVMCKLLIG